MEARAALPTNLHQPGATACAPEHACYALVFLDGAPHIAGQAEASSMPSIATSTMKSISSGVMQNGGMK